MNKSDSLQLGYLVVPQVLNDTLLNSVLLDKNSRKGKNVAADYRVYPFSRNRRPAPDGLYFGGYLSYTGTSSESSDILMNASADDNILFNARMNLITPDFNQAINLSFRRSSLLIY